MTGKDRGCYSLKIAIIGAGYVGLANAMLLSQNNTVFVVDIVPEKIKMLNNKISPIIDDEIIYFLKKKAWIFMQLWMLKMQ